MKPITPAVRQVDVFGGFTAAAGHSFYTARAFPKKYWNTVAFVTEPTGHIVHQNVMTKKGTDFEDVDGFNLLAGADEWVSPVAAEVGPDGAVWIADWYSFIIQHNPTPKGFENGPGNAYQTDLRDYTHGRIYRVGYKQAPPYKPLVLSKDKPQELVAALKNNNMFWRQSAQRLLIERNNRDVVPQLLALLQDQSVDEIGINPGAIHALWTLKGLGVLEGADASAVSAVYGALKHPAHAVRKTAVQVLPYQAASVNALLQANSLNDNEPLVVLHSLLALSQMPLSAEAEKAVLTRMESATEATDRWLPDAFASVLTSDKGKLLHTYLQQLAGKASTTQKTASTPISGTAHQHAAMQTASNTAATQKTVDSANKPDLVITSVRTEPASPALRETVRLFVEVQNQGEVAIANGTVTPLSIRIEGNNKLINLVSLVHTAGLAPGEKVVIAQGTNGPWTGPLSFNSDQPGSYQVTVVADKDNQITEGNEKNNTASYKIVYQAPQSLASYALERAVRSYTSVAEAPEVVSLLKQSRQLAPTESGAIIKGVTTGWNMKKKTTVEDRDKAFLVSLENTIGADNRERYHQLLQAWGLRKAEESANPNAQVIQIKAVREALQFDKKEFTVKAGQPVEIVFENPDAMQHNIVIGKPKSLDVIGAAADKLITAKDGAQKNYVPSINEVIAATPLVNPDQTYRLTFTAPKEKGNYPFVCTFPGHWRIMNGIMKVVEADLAK
jgi:azurin